MTRKPIRAKRGSEGIAVDGALRQLRVIDLALEGMSSLQKQDALSAEAFQDVMVLLIDIQSVLQHAQRNLAGGAR